MSRKRRRVMREVSASRHYRRALEAAIARDLWAWPAASGMRLLMYSGSMLVEQPSRFDRLSGHARWE